MTLPQAYLLLKHFPYVDAWTETPKPEGDRAQLDFRGRKDLSPIDKARIARSGGVEVNEELLREYHEKRAEAARRKAASSAPAP